MSVIAEMRRRRVFRALFGYGVAAFAVLQIVEPVMHALHWPEPVLTWIVLLLAAGFPLVLVLAWVFDLREGRIERTPQGGAAHGTRVPIVLATLGALAAAPGLVWYFGLRTTHAELPAAEESRDPLAKGRFHRLTDFGGSEQAAAISRDGRLVAFLSDRSGHFDVWVTQVGTGQFYNLTRGRIVGEVVNGLLRTLSFSPDGALVTFWSRGMAGAGKIGIWAVPVLGGDPRPYMDGAAECDWSKDGTRLVFHTPGPGDPTFVAERDQPLHGHQVFVAAEGLHAHFPLWSEDSAFIYFVQGTPPDAFDIWRIRPTGGAPEQITHHNSRVTHPVLLDQGRLMYLATSADGSGPWIHVLDIERGASRRMGEALDRYTSLAASAGGTRVVATLQNRAGTLWRLPVRDTPVDLPDATRIALTTGRGFSPRLGPGYLVYVSSKGTGEGIWRLAGETATEIWSAPNARIIGGPEVSPGGERIAFAAEQDGKTALYVVDANGTNLRTVTASLTLQGNLAWTRDGTSLTTAAIAGGFPQLFRVSFDGASTPLVRSYALSPVWSPSGELLVYSGPDTGTSFGVKAVTSRGEALPFPALTLSRDARRMRFLGGDDSLVVIRGASPHRDLWRIDLKTGAEKQLTRFAADFYLGDFDVSPDGRELVVERVQDRSDIVLMDL